MACIIDRRCLYCNKDINNLSKNSKFCNSLCKQRKYLNVQLLEVNCTFCKKKFLQKIKTQGFCTPKCRKDYAESKKLVLKVLNCDICNKEFKQKQITQKYCSKTCSHKIQNDKKRILKGIQTYHKICLLPSCSKEFTTSLQRQIYCTHLCHGIHKREKSFENRKMIKCGIDDCENTFLDKHDRKYCSPECLKKSRLEAFRCEVCKRWYTRYVNKWLYRRRYFCSSTCQRKVLKNSTCDDFQFDIIEF